MRETTRLTLLALDSAASGLLRLACQAEFYTRDGAVAAADSRVEVSLEQAGDSDWLLTVHTGAPTPEERRVQLGLFLNAFLCQSQARR